MAIKSFDEALFAAKYPLIVNSLMNNTADSSAFRIVAAEMNKAFLTGGLSNDQIAIALAQFYSSAYATLESQAIGATLKMFDSQIEEDLKTQEALLATGKVATETQQTALVTKEALFKVGQTSLVEQQTLVATESISTEIKKIAVMTADIAVKNKDVSFKESQISLVEEQILVATESIATETKKVDVMTADIALKNREVIGFDDNLKVKATEFNGQVASFAVNANALNVQRVVDRFNQSICNMTPGKVWTEATWSNTTENATATVIGSCGDAP